MPLFVSVTLPFDPARPYPGVGWNKGCPPGYFAQFVGEGQTDAMHLPENSGGVATRCRVMPNRQADPVAWEVQVTEILEETGTTLAETIEHAEAAVQQTYQNIRDNLEVGLSWMPLVVVAAIAGLVLFAGGHVAPPRLRSNPRRSRQSYHHRTVRRLPSWSRASVGTIPGRLLEMRYRRTGQNHGLYKHRFASTSKMLALRDGSILVAPTGRRLLWGSY